MQNMKKFHLVFFYNLLVRDKNTRPNLGTRNTFSQKVGLTLQEDLISKSQTLAFSYFWLFFGRFCALKWKKQKGKVLHGNNLQFISQKNLISILFWP